MPARILRKIGIANPTIDQILRQFLADQRERLSAKTLGRYEYVLELLQHHLDRYGHEGLSKAERELFERLYRASGKEHREFSRIFGPEKIPENLGMFLTYFMVRKVIASADLKRAAGTVTWKLSKWLAEKGHITKAAALDGAGRGADAARNLPKAERAAQILYEATDSVEVDFDNLAAGDYLEFDHMAISKIEPGRLWLLTHEGRSAKHFGPLAVPVSATKLLELGWEISCSLFRSGGKWHLSEVANVYPL